MTKRTSVILAALIAGVGLLLWAPWRRAGDSVQPAGVVEPPEAPAPTAGSRETVVPLTRPIRSAAPRSTVAATTAAPSTTVTLITNWPEVIDGILESADPEPKKAEQLLAMLPNLPLDGQEQAAQHMVNLLGDEQFPATAQFLDDTNTPETVITILMNDLLNRPSPVKLPMLLALAQVPGHPLAEESRTILGIYVEKDFGDNWDEWRKGIDEYLKTEAALEAATPATPVPPTDTPAPPSN